MNKCKFPTISAMMIIAASLISVSCSKDDVEPDYGLQTEIRLSTGIEVQSRAAFTEADTQIATGQTVAVWVDQVATGTPQLYGKNTLTSDGKGGLSGGTKMFFPMNGNNVDIYALHTNATWTGTDYPTATMTHTVNADQQTLANYAASDLLYATAKNVTKTGSAVPLTFYHLLSKLQVAIVPTDGLTASDIKSVTIGGVKCLANLTLDKAVAPNAATITAGGSASSITVGKDISKDFTSANVKYNDAIIVPQTIATETTFLTVTLSDGTNLIYRLTADAIFASGKKYSLHMTVSSSSIKLSTSVSDWQPGDLITGSDGITRYIVTYTDTTEEIVYTEKMGGTISLNGTNKTVKSITLPDFDKSYLIGRANITSLTLSFDKDGNLRFRPSVDGYTPIGSYAEFQLINTIEGTLAGNYKQEADLDLMGEEWTPIGYGSPFTGKYDGNRCNIGRLKIGSYTYVGLFGYIKGNYSEIHDIYVTSGIINDGEYSGGICGYSDGGNIIACSNAALINSSSRYVGGITGYNTGSIIACQNSGSLSTDHYSYPSFTGGIVGLNGSSGKVKSCYNTGEISSFSASSARASAGGLVGSNSGTIIACYTIGTTRSTYSGGIAGGNSGIMKDNYWKTGDGVPTYGIGNESSNNGCTSFTDNFTPDTTSPEWGLGTGETNGWWKNYNGNNGLPQLYWE